jgi:hypothetical protein
MRALRRDADGALKCPMGEQIREDASFLARREFAVGPRLTEDGEDQSGPRVLHQRGPRAPASMKLSESCRLTSRDRQHLCQGAAAQGRRAVSQEEAHESWQRASERCEHSTFGRRQLRHGIKLGPALPQGGPLGMREERGADRAPELHANVRDGMNAVAPHEHERAR